MPAGSSVGPRMRWISEGRKRMGARSAVRAWASGIDDVDEVAFGVAAGFENDFG